MLARIGLGLGTLLLAGVAGQQSESGRWAAARAKPARPRSGVAESTPSEE
jgi:hypothetical protein